jgi:hypothetical protein
MKKVMFFQCGIRNPLVYILYVSKEKVMFFQCGIKNFLKYSFKLHNMYNLYLYGFFHMKY